MSLAGLAPRTTLAAVMAWLALTMLTGCGVSPDDPEPGELTAVVVSRADHPMIDFGSGPSDTYTRVLVLTEEDMLEAFEQTWPGYELPQQFEYAYLGVDVPLAEVHDLEDGGDPVDGPAVANVSEGRVRVPWSGEPRYLCFGNLNDREEVHTAGCVLVDEDPPAAVTVQISIGGLSLDD